ncbi:MAG: hypothetical protein P1U86_07725 [Verrucomicrobiales bacterium]|nr:hypothetical protein [Verrucomicrobiales bacterium]
MKTFLHLSLATVLAVAPTRSIAEPIDVGTRRELFTDGYLIEKMSDLTQTLHTPRDEGIALKFDKPWEGKFSAYATIIKNGDLYQFYYRGHDVHLPDGSDSEVTAYAESSDGIQWTKPNLNQIAHNGTKENNIVLAGHAPISHNFSPFLDTNPKAKPDSQYKALGGTKESGLKAYTSPDGKTWSPLQSDPVIPNSLVEPDFPYYFDSQNVSFWSGAEKQYVCFFRVFKDKIRRIARTDSDDFMTWSKPVLMEYEHRGGEAPIEHLYTSQTHPYFRAPHLYVSLAARFMPGRQVLTDAQAKEIGVNPSYFKDTSDAIFMTTRPGSDHYDRTFLSSFVRPGIGAQNWVSRTNYPALNTVQTGPTEMSFYLNQDYAQPTAHLHRYSLRLDGFASIRGDYKGGELITKPVRFSGDHLEINFSTSAAGGVRVELLDESGTPIPGFSEAEATEQIGNEISRRVSWKAGDSVASLEGKAVKIRFLLKDADLYSFRFGN